jgi:hypothetical protein
MCDAVLFLMNDATLRCHGASILHQRGCSLLTANGSCRLVETNIVVSVTHSTLLSARELSFPFPRGSLVSVLRHYNLRGWCKVFGYFCFFGYFCTLHREYLTLSDSHTQCVEEGGGNS